MLGACGRPKSPPPPVVNPSETEDSRRVIATGAVELKASRDDGSLAWTLHGASARVGLDDDGQNQLFASQVEGEVYEKGKVASTFRSQEAKAASETRQMVLTGKVRIDSVRQNVFLTADKVSWMEDLQLFSAKGNVRIESPAWELGKMDEVWATPDLSRIGTPDKFK